MSNNFPGALNTGSSLVNTRNTGDSIPVSDHNDLVNAELAVETKLGIGSSTPTTVGNVLTVTAAGQTAWSAAGGYTLPSATSTVLGGINLTGDLTGTATSPALASVGSAGTYGSSTAVPVITTDSKGRVTAVSTATITGGGGGTGPATYFNVKAYGAYGDGAHDDTAAIQSAINAALATSRGTAAVYLPAGVYKITSTLQCSSATSSASGYGVKLIGDGHQASQIFKNSSFGVAVAWLGNQGPAGNPTAFGGMQNITVAGNATTGGLVRVVAGQQMFFSGVSLIGSNDVALDLQCTQDCYWNQVTFNNCGSTSKAPIEIYGDAYGTSNMLWFTQIRVETFLKGAVHIYRGAGATGGGNNGIFWNQCKFENYPTVHGDVFTADGYTQQLYMSQIFFSIGQYDSGYSTPADFIVFGDGSTGSGFNQASFKDIFVNAGPTSGIGNTIVNVKGSSAMNGVITFDNLFSDATLTTGQVKITGASNLKFGIGYIDGPGTQIAGDGSGTRKGYTYP